jgi:hypothetical protein
MVGLSRFELLTPRLSSVCSNQLSYRPDNLSAASVTLTGPVLSKLDRTCVAEVRFVPDRSFDLSDSALARAFRRPLELRRDISRKEVIQPQVLLQLPCYDFTPITDHTLSACPPCGLTRRFLVQPAFVM